MKVLEDELQRTFECGRIIEELHHEQRRIRPAPSRELFGRIERAGPRALQRGCDGQPECFRVIGSVVERQPGAVGARQPLRGKRGLPGPGARGHDASTRQSSPLTRVMSRGLATVCPGRRGGLILVSGVRGPTTIVATMDSSLRPHVIYLADVDDLS